ncbi:MAG TPA: DUF1592 domain-containing protein [Bryobacteraceae bacterium]|nr:DUF1592 domain-containing protein [Bryobacteraceae bacterium]
MLEFELVLSKLIYVLLVTVGHLAAQPSATYSFREARGLMKTYCQKCHQGKTAVGGFDLAKFPTLESALARPILWTRAVARVRRGEMPPKGHPAPSIEQREEFSTWMEQTLRSAACVSGLIPGPSPTRRLNRSEYTATVRDLLNIQVNAGRALPADGAGGEGFDNAAETLFLSPIHAEKYLEAAKEAVHYGSQDPRSRAAFLIAEPNDTTTPEPAARKVLEAFLPRAFRRPTPAEEIERYLAMFRGAMARGETYNDAIQFALRAVLISPHFLFRVEDTNRQPGPRLLDNYALATRLSYFLWGSMPDKTLTELAAKGKLQEREVLNEQIVRLLKDAKSLGLAENFVEQWLNTRELGRDIKPDPQLSKDYYDAEIRSAIRYEPILFFQEIVTNDLPLLTLLDAKFTILTNKLARFYGLPDKGLRQQPKRVELPGNSHRGGLLSMSAVLAVSSYPQRTSPVLRGKWVLDAILGTPPPPPPPNVPELKEVHSGDAPQTVRERLMRHRENPVCASCHNRIDPLGFGLENYDMLGRWRTEDAGKAIDSKGELPDGTAFDGPDQLKAVLLSRKDLFVRNLTAKMLGYALGRGLTLPDYCTVDRIVEQLEKNGYSSHTLIKEIVWSVPFRYQAGVKPGLPVQEDQ